MGESEPDLSAGERWLAARTQSERKGMGQWPTPWWVIQGVLDKVLDDVPAGGCVIDPACGDARWLVAVGQRRPDLQLVGIELDPEAVRAARDTVRLAGLTVKIVAGDGLGAWPVTPDLVVGNPPFVRPQNLPKKQRDYLWSRFKTATNKADLYAFFTERCLEECERVALVLPNTWLHIDSFRAMRELVSLMGVDLLARLPAGVFRGARVFPVVLITGGERRGEAGEFDRDGWRELGPLYTSRDAWSLDGPLPELLGRPLGEFVSIHMGVVCGDYERYVHEERSHEDDRPTCRGRDVKRWKIARRDEFVRYQPADMLARKPYVAPKHAGIFDVPRKIVLAGTSGRELRAAMDEEQLFAMDSCYVLLPKGPEVDLWAVLGFLNSPQVGAWYGARHRAARVKGVEVARIPLPETGWEAVAEAARARDEEALERAAGLAYGPGSLENQPR